MLSTIAEVRDEFCTALSSRLRILGASKPSRRVVDELLRASARVAYTDSPIDRQFARLAVRRIARILGGRATFNAINSVTIEWDGDDAPLPLLVHAHPIYLTAVTKRRRTQPKTTTRHIGRAAQ